MTPEELDEATVEEAKRRWLSTPALRIHGTLGEDAPFIAARLAREAVLDQLTSEAQADNMGYDND